MISFPFDNKSPEIQDRVVDSDVFSDYLDRLVGSSGIFSELGNKGKVTPGVGMQVNIGPCDGIIQGKFFIEDLPTAMPIRPAGVYDRIDTIVIRMSKASRDVTFKVIEGPESTKPIPAPIIREGGVYDVALADVFISHTATKITPASISDQRLNPDRGGVVPIFGKVDTRGLYDQIEDALNTFQTQSFEEFDSWFQGIKGQLSGDVAGNLTNQISELNDRLEREEEKIQPVEKGGTGRTNLLEFLRDIGLEIVDVPITRESHNVGSTETHKCIYVKALNMCFFTGNVPPRKNVSYPANNRVVLWNVPDNYKPGINTALAVQASGSTPLNGYVSIDRGIKIIPKGSALSKGYSVVVSGAWFVKEA